MKRLVRDASLILIGSAALYVASVACSSDSGAGSPPGGNADAGRDSNGLLDVVRDVLAEVFDAAPDAVRDSMAQTPTSVTAQCNVLIPAPTGTGNLVFAEASFPGKTLEQLALTTAILPISQDDAGNVPPGYTHYQTIGVALKPGSVVMQCGRDTTAGVLNRTVTFVVP
jgi:hypothetical protein